MKRPSKHYATDSVFHNNLLEVLEDCVVESDYSNQIKQQVILILYTEFYDTTPKGRSVLGKSLKPKYVMEDF